MVRVRGDASEVDVNLDTDDRKCMGRSSCTSKLPNNSIASEVHDPPKAGAVRRSSRVPPLATPRTELSHDWLASRLRPAPQGLSLFMFHRREFLRLGLCAGAMPLLPRISSSNLRFADPPSSPRVTPFVAPLPIPAVATPRPAFANTAELPRQAVKR